MMNPKLFCTTILDKSVCLINGGFGRFTKLVVDKIPFPLYKSSDLPVLTFDNVLKDEVHHGQGYENGSWSDLTFDVITISHQTWFLVMILVMIFLAMMFLAMCSKQGKDLFKMIGQKFGNERSSDIDPESQRAITFERPTERAITFERQTDNETGDELVQDDGMGQTSTDRGVWAPAEVSAPTLNPKWTTASKWSR